MSNETRDIPNTSKNAAAEGYDVGYSTDAPSYWELNNDLIVEAFTRLAGVSETNVNKPTVNASEALSFDGTSLQPLLKGHVMPIAAGLDASDAVDPGATGTPVQDAIDATTTAVAAGQPKTVVLPASVTEEAAVTAPEGLTLTGMYGIGAEIRWPDYAACGLVLDNANDIRLRNLRLTGPGRVSGFTGTTQPAIRATTNNFSRAEFSWLKFDGWVGDGCVFTESLNSWAYIANHWFIGGCDANGGSLFKLSQKGALKRLGYVEVYPTTAYSGIASDIFELDSFNGIIGSLNMGANTDRGITFTGSGSLTINYINYEPTADAGATDAVVYNDGGGKLWLQDIRQIGDEPVDYAVTVRGRCGPVVIGASARAADPFDQNFISVEANASGEGTQTPLWHFGREADIDFGASLPWDARRNIVTFDSFSRRPARSTTSDLTAVSGDTIFADTSSAGVTVTLPAPQAGATVEVSNAYSASGNSLVTQTPGTGQIDGQSSMSTATTTHTHRLICDGTNWFTTGE